MTRSPRPVRTAVTTLASTLSLGLLVGLLVGVPSAATASALPTTVVRLTAGPTPLVDATGHRWTPDLARVVARPSAPAATARGTLRRTTAVVRGTANQALYRRERVGMIGYRIPVPAVGTYRVVLHQAELWATRRGQRVFDVTAEGRTVVSRLDLFAAVGRLRAVSRTFDVPVRDGVLDLRFLPRAGATKITALSVTRLPGVLPRPAPAAPVPAAPVPAAPVPTDRPFAATSAWNTPLPAAPVLDPAGPAMVAHLSSGAHPGIANLYDYGVPVWEADAATPRHRVDCLQSWGTCQLEQTTVPVPLAARPSGGSDGAMVVVDASSGQAYEFWQASPTASGSWQTSWGGVVAVSGSGTPGAAVGSGISRLAGVVRIAELRRGRIDHALVFSTNNACRSVKRYPASKTDGTSLRGDCVPEGARLQLDPSVDVAALPGLTPAERTVAQALQTYGAYAIDNGGSNMGFVFETPSGEADPYPALGLAWDYYGMDRIPWQRLRVLRQWDGA